VIIGHEINECHCAIIHFADRLSPSGSTLSCIDLYLALKSLLGIYYFLNKRDWCPYLFSETILDLSFRAKFNTIVVFLYQSFQNGAVNFSVANTYRQSHLIIKKNINFDSNAQFELKCVGNNHEEYILTSRHLRFYTARF
jgi:hypothetical protein